MEVINRTACGHQQYCDQLGAMVSVGSSALVRNGGGASCDNWRNQCAKSLKCKPERHVRIYSTRAAPVSVKSLLLDAEPPQIHVTERTIPSSYDTIPNAYHLVPYPRRRLRPFHKFCQEYMIGNSRAASTLAGPMYFGRAR